MDDYTFKILGTCTGGEHIRMQVYRDGAELKKIVVNKSEILESAPALDEILPPLMKAAIQVAGAKTLTTARTAVEAMVVKL